jgi:hypothetical protein
MGFIIHYPLFVSLFIGLSLSNAIGIVQGYLGIKSGFIRTPKFNVVTTKEKLLESKYAKIKISWLTLIEGLLIFYFVFGLVQAFYFKAYATLPILLMAFTGFSMVFVWSIQERNKKLLAALHD